MHEKDLLTSSHSINYMVREMSEKTKKTTFMSHFICISCVCVCFSSRFHTITDQFRKLALTHSQNHSFCIGTHLLRFKKFKTEMKSVALLYSAKKSEALSFFLYTYVSFM